MKKIMAFLITLVMAITAILVVMSLTSCSSALLANLTLITPTGAPDDMGTIYPAPPTHTSIPTSTLGVAPYPPPEVLATAPYPGPERKSAGNLASEECEVSTGKANGLLNLRSCAGNSCNVIAILHEGEKVIVLDTGTWLHVLANGETAGYVLGRYCK